MIILPIAFASLSFSPAVGRTLCSLRTISLFAPRAQSRRNLPNSPFCALLDSNAGQCGNPHLSATAGGWRESNRQKDLSDGFEIVVIFRQRKGRRRPSLAALFSHTAACRKRGVYHLRLPQIGNEVGRGCPSGRRVTRMNKINTAGLSIVMSRAGDANARKPA
jgi:hypothetical protein